MASDSAGANLHTPVWSVLIGVAVLAGCTAAAIGALSLADALTATGLPDPGPATTLGLPFVRAAGEVAAVLAVGSFLFAAFLVPPQRSGVLDVSGYRALRLGTVASGVWAVCAALLVPLTISDVSGQRLVDHLNPVQLWSVAGVVNTASAWRWTAALAAIVTLASLTVLRWTWTPLLLLASLVTLIPLGLSGHSSAGGSHVIKTCATLNDISKSRMISPYPMPEQGFRRNLNIKVFRLNSDVRNRTFYFIKLSAYYLDLCAFVGFYYGNLTVFNVPVFRAGHFLRCGKISPKLKTALISESPVEKYSRPFNRRFAFQYFRHPSYFIHFSPPCIK